MNKLISTITLLVALVALASSSCFAAAVDENSKQKSEVQLDHETSRQILAKIKELRLSKNFYDPCIQVKSLGNYGCEHHTVETPDGFLLDQVRIPPRNVNGSVGAGKPILLQHGLLDSVGTWVFNYHDYQNLATILSSQGYDVFMANSRCNHYSIRNAKMKQDTLFFQDCDWDSMASGDVPSNIKYILNFTGHKSLTYVGHSQGTTQLLAYAASGEEQQKFMRDHVDLAVLLAPVAYVRHTTATLLRILADLDTATWLLIFGDKLFLENDWLLRQLSKFCPKILGDLCEVILFPICGQDQLNNINVSQMPSALRFTPGGASVSDLQHWSQMVKNDVFQKHDWGERINEQKYHQKTPPAYPLNTIQYPPIAFAVGDQDALADPADVELMLSDLPRGTVVERLYINGYAHLDPVWSRTANVDLYNHATRWIAKYKRG